MTRRGQHLQLDRVYPSAKEIIGVLGNHGLLSDFHVHNVDQLIHWMLCSEFYAILGGRRGTIGVLWLHVRAKEVAQVGLILDRRHRRLLRPQRVSYKALEPAVSRGKRQLFEAIRDRVFNQLGCHRLEAVTPIDRRSAIRLGNCFEFQWEGISRCHHQVNNRPVDVAIMALTDRATADDGEMR